MDATKLVEDYEAIHATDDYTTDLETLYTGLIYDEASDFTAMYSPEWADRQTAFLASC